MLGKKPSTINFSGLLGPKKSLEKLAHATIREDEINNATLKEKTAMTARLATSPQAKKLAREATRALNTKSRKVDVSHLTGNKRLDPNDSVVTRAGKAFGIPSFFTKNR